MGGRNDPHAAVLVLDVAASAEVGVLVGGGRVGGGAVGAPASPRGHAYLQGGLIGQLGWIEGSSKRE